MKLNNISFIIDDHHAMHFSETEATTGDLEKIMELMQTSGDSVLGVDARLSDGTPCFWRPDTGWGQNTSFVQVPVQDNDLLVGRRVLSQDPQLGETLGFGRIANVQEPGLHEEHATCVFPMRSGAEMAVDIPLESLTVLPDSSQAAFYDTDGGYLGIMDVTDAILFLDDEKIAEIQDGGVLDLPHELQDKIVPVLNEDAVRIELAENVSDYFGSAAVKSAITGEKRVPETIFRQVLENGYQCRMLAWDAPKHDYEVSPTPG